MQQLSMKMKFLFQVLVLAFILNGQDLWSQAPDTTFHFRIEGANNTYNSETATLHRKYTGRVLAFEVQLTKGELQQIRQALSEGHFTELPETFEILGETRTITTPSFSYSLESNFGGTTKKIFYSDRISSPETKEAVAPFMTLYIRIWEIINANAEIKEIRQSDIRYE